MTINIQEDENSNVSNYTASKVHFDSGSQQKDQPAVLKSIKNVSEEENAQSLWKKSAY